MWIQVKGENSSLPVSVRVSKTSVLKLPIVQLSNQRRKFVTRPGKSRWPIGPDPCLPPMPLYVGWISVDNLTYYMTSSVRRQDEPNPALWLATRAGKMELYCPLGISRLVPQDRRSLFWSFIPYYKSFIDQACSNLLLGKVAGKKKGKSQGGGSFMARAVYFHSQTIES